MGTNAGDAVLLTFGARGEARRRLFCVPFAGGRPGHLPPVAADLPRRHRGRRRPAARPRPWRRPVRCWTRSGRSSMPSCPAIGAKADLPFAIFGHSMGALIAFELADRARAGAADPPRRTCSSPGDERPTTSPRRRAIQATCPTRSSSTRSTSSYGGVPDAVRNEPELLALFLPALRADVRTFETYAPLDRSSRSRCPVHVYGGADDTHPRPAELAGWQRVAERADHRAACSPATTSTSPTRATALLADIAARWATAPLRWAPSDADAGLGREPIAIVGIGCRLPGGADSPARCGSCCATGSTPSGRSRPTASTSRRSTTSARRRPAGS